MSVTSTPPPVHGPEEWMKIVEAHGIRPLSDEGYLTAAIYLTVTGILSTVGNSVVLAMFLRDKKLLRKPLNPLLLNLAISDLGISLFGYPWTAASNYAGRYLFGSVFCSIQGFLTFTCAQTGMNTLACISVYHYITICHPKYADNLNYDLAKSTILFTWIYSLVWTTPPLIGWSSYTFESFGTSCSIDWTSSDIRSIAYMLCLLLFCFLVHVVVMVSSCYKIVLQIREEAGRAPVATITNSRTGELVRTVNIKREKKITAITFLLNVTFVMMWLPYTVICLWSVYNKDFPQWVTTFPTFFVWTSCMINPFLNILSSSTLRKKAMRLFIRYPHRVYPYPPRPSRATTEYNKEGIYTGRVTINVQQKESTLL